MARRLLARLENASLLMKIGRRFRFHDRVRDFANAKLGANREDVQRRLPDCWLDWKLIDAEYRQVGAFELAAQYRRLCAAEHDRPQATGPSGSSSTIRLLKLLEKAIRRDVHFIDRHSGDYPQALFQCLWNHGWWYDCPAAAAHYTPPAGGWPNGVPPWGGKPPKLCDLLQRWRDETEPDRPWLRALRPPSVHLASPLQAILRGHEGGVSSVAFSADGGRIVSGSYDNSVRLWDAASGAELACLSGHEETVTSVAFSADGGRIVSGSWDKSVRVWDAASGECLEVIDGTADIEAIAVGNDQRPYRALARSGETVIENARTAAFAAVFPIELNVITTHPSGRQWAGAVA
jgi:hypothetical protein